METPINLFDDSGWEDAQEYPAGTKTRILRAEQGMKTVLLKLPEGFYMKSHTHITAEQHIILKGEYISEGKIPNVEM